MEPIPITWSARSASISDLYKKARTRKFIFPAWEKVERAGRRSPSRETRRVITLFGDSVPRGLERIQETLRAGTYEFQPATGAPIRRSGKSPRPIVVQDVRDRVVQRSLLDVVMEVPEVKSAVDTGRSFGGIPGKRVSSAVEPILRGIRKGAGRYFIRSDIADFFGSMPREEALRQLTVLLPDRSLDQFLETATRTELANRDTLGDLVELFPDSITGVPQGHALSALLGNLILRGLDETINSDGVVGVRYLDDFLILGPDKSTTWRAFRRARKELNDLGLTCYAPGKSNKADEGSTNGMFEFLGCEISPSFVRPSAANRRRLIDRVREFFNSSISAMQSRTFGGREAYPQSVASTLRRASLTIRGWSEQYSFCNYGGLKRDLDEEIADEISRFLGIYGTERAKVTDAESRRMVGVWLLSDADSEPLIEKEPRNAGELAS